MGQGVKHVILVPLLFLVLENPTFEFVSANFMLSGEFQISTFVLRRSSFQWLNVRRSLVFVPIRSAAFLPGCGAGICQTRYQAAGSEWRVSSSARWQRTSWLSEIFLNSGVFSLHMLCAYRQRG